MYVLGANPVNPHVSISPKPQAGFEPRRKPAQARSQATVVAILQASALILRREGRAAFNTNRVAGVGIGSLSGYFPEKDALCIALARQILDEDCPMPTQAVDLANSQNALRVLVGTLLARHRTNRRMRRMVMSFNIASPWATMTRTSGASIRFIRQFEADYKAKPEFLTDNYRSTRLIIDAARPDAYGKTPSDLENKSAQRWPSPPWKEPEVKSSARSRSRKPYRAKCQTETQAIPGGYFACNFRSLWGIAPRMSRKPRHNTIERKLFKINKLCFLGAIWIQTREMFPFPTPENTTQLRPKNPHRPLKFIHNITLSDPLRSA